MSNIRKEDTEPLEFQQGGGGFDELRAAIRDNLLNGVKYRYFVSEDGYNSIKVDAIVSSTLPSADQLEMKRNVTFFLVDRKLFQTYFTLHFAKGNLANPSRVYMSALREDRKRDFLLQIVDAKHVQRIRENMEILLGNESERDGVKVKRFV